MAADNIDGLVDVTKKLWTGTKKAVRRGIEVTTGEDKKILLFVSGEWKFTKDNPINITVIRKGRFGKKERYKAYYIDNGGGTVGLYRLKVDSLNERHNGQSFTSPILNRKAVVRLNFKNWDKASEGSFENSIFKIDTGIIFEDQSVESAEHRRKAESRYEAEMQTEEAERARSDGRLYIGNELDHFFPDFH